MENSDNSPESADDTGAALPESGSFGGRRKRIVSREVSPVQDLPRRVEEEMQSAARGALRPMDVIDIPNLPPRAGLNEVLMDPTLISHRQRRYKQNYLFQLTRVITVLVFLSSCAAIALYFFNHRLWAQFISGTACLSAAASIKLVRSSRLLYRLRGYVAAGCLLSLAAFCVTMWMPSITGEIRSAPPPDMPTTRPASP